MPKSWLALLLDFIVPPRCVHCGRIGPFLCSACLLEIEYLETLLCPVCTRAAIDGFTHPGCRTLYSPDRLFCPFYYRGPMAAAIKKFKYKKRVLAVGQTLVDLLLAEIGEQALSLGRRAIVVPVPLHSFKRMERGYNQAEVLGRLLAGKLDLKFEPSWLERTRETVSQTKLKARPRRENVRGAFSVPDKHKRKLKGKDIVLFDDVFTTGATARECARALKKAGARFVYIVALAKD